MLYSCPDVYLLVSLARRIAHSCSRAARWRRMVTVSLSLTHTHVTPSIYLSASVSPYLTIYLCLQLSIYLYLSPSIYLCLHPSILLSPLSTHSFPPPPSLPTHAPAPPAGAEW